MIFQDAVEKVFSNALKNALKFCKMRGREKTAGFGPYGSCLDSLGEVRSGSGEVTGEEREELDSSFVCLPHPALDVCVGGGGRERKSSSFCPAPRWLNTAL